MISGVAVGDGKTAHAGSLCRQHAFLGVFEHGAFGRSDTKAIGRFKENIRRRFDSGDIRDR